MRLAIKLAAALLAAGVSAQAVASFTGGNELYSGLQTYREARTDVTLVEAARGGRAVGYVIGVFDALEIMNFFCLPADATRGQVIDVVLQHLRGNPATRHKEAHLLVAEALNQSFPCKK